MASRKLFVRTFTLILHPDKPPLTQRFEVPELESWEEFLVRLKKASEPIASPILPTDANKNSLTVYEDHWWFSLLERKGVERSEWVYLGTEYSYEWVKDKLLEWNTEWRAVLIHHVGPTSFQLKRQSWLSVSLCRSSVKLSSQLRTSPQTRRTILQAWKMMFLLHQLHITTLRTTTLQVRL
ncbi:MAG: hypothetical protein Q9173_005471 [Seirophora scorigena]